MTSVETRSAQMSCAGSNSASTFPLTALLVDFFGRNFSLVKKYYWERNLSEILLEGVVVAVIAAVIYAGHALLVSVAAVWCLVMFSLASYRLLALRSQDDDGVNVEMTDALQEDASDMTELAKVLT